MTWAGPIPKLRSEDEERLIEAFASQVVSMGMSSAAILFLEGIRPMSKYIAEVPLLMASPFLEAIGINSYDYVALIGKRDSVERIIQRIEQMEEEKKLKKENELDPEPETKEKSLFKRIKKVLFGI